MTVGQRIAQKRKEMGLSQEALGEQLGVSRQAIYKWESDATLPEIEKLIALSKIFGVSVGWLLGVEDGASESDESAPSAPVSGELTQAQLDMVEEIVCRYQAAQSIPPKRRKWPWALVALVLIIVFAKLFSTLNDLQNDFNRIENSVSYIDRNVDNQISSITNRVENILNRMNNFTVEHSAEILNADLAANTVTFKLSAVPKTYTEGMTAVFQAEYGDGVVEVEAKLGENQNYSGTLTCPLTDEITLSVVFVTGEKRETQSIQTYTGLYTGSFPIRHMNTEPLYFTMEGDLFSREYFSVNLNHHDEGDMPVAEIRQMRLGLFEDNKLLYWLERVEEQPETFVGDWGDAIYFRNPQEYTLNREKTYCLALVVTDEYDRESVCSDIPVIFSGGEDDGRWTYSNDGRTSHDPADWEY